MNLTQRRRDFLECLVDIYNRTVRPVHYETLAQAVGVSKWTAYDMLKELEKAGFLAREYVVPNGVQGRSKLVYVPTESAYSIIGRARTDSAIEEETVNRAKDKVLKWNSAIQPNDVMKEIFQDIQDSRNQVEFCIYVLGLLVIVLRTTEENTVHFIKRFVLRSPSADMRLAVFTGALFATVLPSIHSELSIQVVDLIEDFLKEVTSLSSESNRVVSAFLDQVLSSI